MDSNGKSKRRSFLRRTALVLAGLAGVEGGAQAADPVSKGNALTFYAGQWLRHAPGQKPGELPKESDRHMERCELWDQPGGRKVGELCGACFGHGPSNAAGQHLMLHSIQLEAGTLFAMGAGEISGEPTFAILGGTGRFVGVKGTMSLQKSAAKVDGLMPVKINLS
jgi:hypothetical protein